MPKEKAEEEKTPGTPEASQEAEEENEDISPETVDKILAGIGEDGTPSAPDGDNVEKETEEEGETPEGEPAPTFDPSVLQTPEAQAALAGALARTLEGQKTKEQADEATREVLGLVKQGNFDELGKRWAKAIQEQQIGAASLDGFLREFYTSVFADPIFQSLTAEERAEINPAKFSDDASYMKHLAKFMAKKEREAGLEETVQERVREAREADKREAAGEKARKGAVSGAPPAPAGEPKEHSQDARVNITEGLRETFGDNFAQ